MEQLLYHIWQNKLFDTANLRLTDGTPFEIIDFGLRNPDAGPDFFNAKIKTYQTVWAGNIEFHNSSSDWFAHHHHKDKAYDNVILNVVTRHDCDVFRTKGDKIAQYVIPVDEKVLNDYSFLTSLKTDAVACGHRIQDVEPIIMTDWIHSLAVQRVINKADRLKCLAERYAGDWEEAIYIQLCRSFGMGINGEPFERLGRSVPLQILRKHLDSRLLTEALLMGQAGFLEQESSEDPELAYTQNPYYILLRREYDFLKSKFRLRPMSKSVWKLLRLRPYSFPQLRIAALAAFLNSHPRFFSAFVEAESPADLKDLFKVDLSLFWENHYCFDSPSESRIKGMGDTFFYSIMINTLIPLLFAYGRYSDNAAMQQRALDFLDNMPAENNKIIRNWREVGVTVNSALDSQAIIQLQKEFCDKKECFSCRIGAKLLSK